jgi:hypothetical protein
VTLKGATNKNSKYDLPESPVSEIHKKFNISKGPFP